jgi:hypothetical protein
MNLNTLIVILTTTILLVVGAVLAYLFYFRQRSRRLKADFGPEYDRTVEKMEDRKQAEDALENRQERLASFHIRELDAAEKEQFLKKWRSVQAGFVEQPGGELREAERLVTEVMLARGYPMTQFGKRVENLSVNHPEMVPQYRQAHAVAEKNNRSETSIEELRQAMINYKMIFEKLLGVQTIEELETA